MIDPASKSQYIQRVTNAKLDVGTTGSLQTIYTAPSGTDFDFAVVESILIGDDGNQQTDIDLAVVSGGTTHYLFKEHNITAHETDEMLSRDLVLTAGEILSPLDPASTSVKNISSNVVLVYV